MAFQFLLALPVLFSGFSAMASPPETEDAVIQRLLGGFKVQRAPADHIQDSRPEPRHRQAPQGSFLQTYMRLEFEGNVDNPRDRWVTLFQNKEERNQIFQRVEEILALSKRRATPLEEARKLWDQGQKEIENLTSGLKNRLDNILRGGKDQKDKDIGELLIRYSACDCRLGACDEEAKNLLHRMKMMAFLFWDYEHTQYFNEKKQIGRERAAARFQQEFEENFSNHLNPDSSLLLNPTPYSAEYPDIAKAMLAASEIFAERNVQAPSRNAPAAIAGLESLNALCSSQLPQGDRFAELADLISSVHWTDQNRIMLLNYLLKGEVPLAPYPESENYQPRSMRVMTEALRKLMELSRHSTENLNTTK